MKGGRIPKVGIALGAGALRGLAHIGVLKKLEERRIPIDVIAGCSIGAIIGGIYSAGRELSILERLLMCLRWEHILDFGIPRMGLVQGDKILEVLRLLTGNKSFDELDITFGVVAVDIERGEEVIITEGNVAEAIRASISIPGIFAPYRYRGRLMVDGALLNRVPVDIAKNLGADMTIAVMINPTRKRSRVRSMVEVIWQSLDLMESEIAKSREMRPDVVISPRVDDIGITRLDRAADLVRRGEEAASESIPDILRIMEGRSLSDGNE